jgi:hypothetical protein
VLPDERYQTGALRARGVRFGFTQLYGWAQELPQVFAVKGVLSTDIDEARNRLAIGIENEARRGPVEEQLTRLGIPRDAAIIEVREPAVFMQATLRDRIRNIRGGLKIDDPRVDSWCTIGFNLTYAGLRAYATNGHCSLTWGGVEPTNHWQTARNTAADLIGNEYTEAGRFSSAYDSRCPSTANICAYSDIMIGAYNTGTSPQAPVGYIIPGRTRNQLGTDSAIAARADLQITGEQIWPAFGDVVEKVGARTGWTYGGVISACATELVQGFYFICTYRVSAATNGGDSGSGVFFYDGVSNATLTGQLFAGTNFNGLYFQEFLFSPLNNIQSEFGNLITTIYGT